MIFCCLLMLLELFLFQVLIRRNEIEFCDFVVISICKWFTCVVVTDHHHLFVGCENGPKSYNSCETQFHISNGQKGAPVQYSLHGVCIWVCNWS